MWEAIPWWAIEALFTTDAGESSKLDIVCSPDDPWRALSSGKLQDCSRRRSTAGWSWRPAYHVYQGSGWCPARWTGFYRHSVEADLTTSRSSRHWWRPWLGQPDQRHPPAYTSRETVYRRHTDARRTRAIRPVSEYRPYRRRRGEGRAPSPAPHQNTQLRNARQIHSSELSACDRRWTTASSRMLIPWAQTRWTTGRAGWSDRPCQKRHSHRAEQATRSVPCPLRRECQTKPKIDPTRWNDAGLGSSVGWAPARLTYVFAKGRSDRVRDQLTPRNSLQ